MLIVSGSVVENSSCSIEELVNNVKEPEEPDHQAHCDIFSHEASAVNQSSLPNATPTVSDGRRDGSWLYILGHDKLKKRVRETICAVILVTVVLCSALFG